MADDPDPPPPARHRPPPGRISPQSLADARGGAVEGLAWLGRTPESRASVFFRLVRLFARFTLFGIFRFRVETSGGPIECERIVDCAGVAAGEISALVGVPLPVESWPLQAHVTEPVAPLVRHLVYFAGERLTLKQAAVGSVLIGGGWPSKPDPETGKPAVSYDSLHANLRVARHVVPALAGVRLLRVWTGVCNGTPDHRPILGELDNVPGFFVAAFPFLGFTAAPLLGKLVADLARGRAVPYDLGPFAASRFSPVAPGRPAAAPASPHAPR